MIKKFFFAILFCLVSLGAWAQNPDLAALNGEQGVEYIRMDGEMLRATLEAYGTEVNIEDALKAIDGLTIIMIDRNESKKSYLRAQKILSRMESLDSLSLKTDKKSAEKLSFYTRPLADGKTEYIAAYIDTEDIILIEASGEMTLADAMELLKIKMK